MNIETHEVNILAVEVGCEYQLHFVPGMVVCWIKVGNAQNCCWRCLAEGWAGTQRGERGVFLTGSTGLEMMGGGMNLTMVLLCR